MGIQTLRNKEQQHAFQHATSDEVWIEHLFPALISLLMFRLFNYW